MAGVRDFGKYFEEFVKDYMKVVKELDLVEMEYPYTIHKEDYKERRSAEYYPGDIDVIGLKNDEIWIVECKEAITKRPSGNDVEEMEDRFRNINEFTDKKFPDKSIKKFIAYITNENNITEQDFKNEKILLLSFEDMAKQFIQKTIEQKNIATLGRYHWFLEKLKRVNLIDKDSFKISNINKNNSKLDIQQ